MMHETDNTAASARPSRLAMATGLNTAIVVSYLLCKPPQTHTLSWETRLLTSVLYLLIACLSGAAGTWIALSRDRRTQFRNLVLWGARGWVFLPAMMMFLRERSIWTPVIAVLSAALMAAHLGSLTEQEDPYPEIEKNIFITQLHFRPISWTSFEVSLCLYGAFLSAVQGNLALLTLLLGAAAFLLVSQIAAALSKTEREENQRTSERSRRYSWAALALCCAFVALSASSVTSEQVWEMRAFHVWKQALSPPRPVKPQPSDEHSSGGYRTIVLWPIQKKEKVLPAPPSSLHPSSPDGARPWVIPFYGPYWYFKTPGESPGPKARIARGDPLKVNVRSTDSARLLMEAHQNLADPVDLACCREMQVVFKNDVSLGATEVGILLTDSHAPAKPSQNLGIKYVALDSVDQPPGDTSSVEETVSFPFPSPKSGKIKKFDQITVVLFPDANRLTAGRKVAVERFIMIPN